MWQWILCKYRLIPGGFLARGEKGRSAIVMLLQYNKVRMYMHGYSCFPGNIYTILGTIIIMEVGVNKNSLVEGSFDGVLTS